MGNGKIRDSRVQFDDRLKLDILRGKGATGAGRLARRVFDEAFALTEICRRQGATKGLAPRDFRRSEPRIRG